MSLRKVNLRPRSVRPKTAAGEGNSKHDLNDVNRDILFIEGVARIFGCSVDHIRRIPQSDLPRASVGKRALFLKSSCINYVKKLMSDEMQNDELALSKDFGQADLLADEIRKQAEPKN